MSMAQRWWVCLRRMTLCKIPGSIIFILPNFFFGTAERHKIHVKKCWRTCNHQRNQRFVGKISKMNTNVIGKPDFVGLINTFHHVDIPLFDGWMCFSAKLEKIFWIPRSKSLKHHMSLSFAMSKKYKESSTNATTNAPPETNMTMEKPPFEDVSH